MGLREKVALVLIAVLLQTAYTECKPQSLKKNPFEQYVGRRGNGKNTAPNNSKSSPAVSYSNAQRDTLSNPNIYKTFNFPEVDFPSDTSHKEPSLFNYGSLSKTRTSPSKMYDPALLDSFKKEARKKRKSKKHANENTQIKAQLTEPQPLYVNDKGTFPEVEYPLNAMDTWTPKYWNSVPYNIDEPISRQTKLGPRTQGNTKRNKVNGYKQLTNTKQNNRQFLAAEPAAEIENRNKKINSINPGGNEVIEVIAPVKTETENIPDTPATSSQSHQKRRKLKKRLKTAASRNKLNNIKKFNSTKTRPQLDKLLKIEAPDLNKNAYLSENSTRDSKPMRIENTLNNTVFNITVTNASSFKTLENSFINDGKVDKLVLDPSSSNIDNFDKADYAQIAKLSSLEPTQPEVTQTNHVLTEYEQLPKNVSPKIISPDNHNLLPAKVDRELSADNLNGKLGKNQLQSHIANLTVLYYLVESVLNQISSQRNNIYAQNDTSVVSTDTLPIGYIIPNSPLPDNINDVSVATSTDEVMPERILMNYNMNDTSVIDPVEPSSTPLIPDNHTDSLLFCPLPAIDQCSIYNQTKRNSSNSTDITLIQILNGNVTKNILENSNTMCDNSSLTDFSDNYTIHDVLAYNVIKDELNSTAMSKMPDIGTVANIAQCYKFQTMPENQILLDMPSNGTSQNFTVHISLSEMPNNSTLRINFKNCKISDIPNIERLDEQLTIDKIRNMTINDTLLNMTDNETLEHKSGNYGSNEMLDDTLSDILDYETLSDIPDGDTSSEITNNNALSDISEYTRLSYIPENNTLENIPENDKLSDISNHKTFENKLSINIIKDKAGNDTLLNVKPDYETLNYKLEQKELKIPLEDTLLRLLEVNNITKIDKLSDMSNNKTLQDIPTNDKIVNTPFNDALSDIHEPNNDELNEILEDTLSNIPKYKTLEDLPVNNKLEEMLVKNTVANMTEYFTLSDMPRYDKLENKRENYRLSDIPNDKTLEDKPTTNKIGNDPVNNAMSYMSDHKTVEQESINYELNETLEDIILPIISEYETMKDLPGRNNFEDVLFKNTLECMSKHDRLPDMPNNDTLGNRTENYEFSDMPINKTLGDKQTNNKVGNNPVNDTLSDMPDHKTLDHEQDNDESNETREDIFLNISEYETLKDLPDSNNFQDVLVKNALTSMSKNNRLPDMPNNDTLGNRTENYEFSDMPINKTLDDKQTNNKVGNNPVNDTLSHMQDHKTLDHEQDNDESNETREDILPNISENESLKDLPDSNNFQDRLVKNTLASISKYDRLSDMPDNYTLRNIQENNSLSNVPNSNTLEAKSSNNKIEEESVSITLSDNNIPDHKTLNHEPDNDELNKTLDDTISADIPMYDTVEDLPDKDKLEDILLKTTLASMLTHDILLDIPSNDRLENMTQNYKLLDMPNNKTLEDNPTNNIKSNKSINNTLADISYHKTLDHKPNNSEVNKTLEDIPDITVGNLADSDISEETLVHCTLIPHMPEYETVENLAESDTSEETLEHYTLIPHTPEYETVENLADSDTSEETLDYCILIPHIPEYDISKISDNQTLENSSDNDTLKESPEYDKLNYERFTVVSDNEILEAIPKYDTLSDMSQCNSSKDISNNNLFVNIPEYIIMCDMPINYTMSNKTGNSSNQILQREIEYDALKRMPNSGTLKNMSECHTLQDKSECETMTDMGNYSLFSHTTESNELDSQDMPLNIYHNNIEALSVKFVNNKSAETIMVDNKTLTDNESLNNAVQSDIFNSDDATPNVTASNAILISNISNRDGNDFNITFSDLPEMYIVPKFDISADTDIISEIFNTENVSDISLVDELFGMEPSTNNSYTSSDVLDTVKPSVNDVDDLLDTLLDLLIADLKKNMGPDDETLLSSSTLSIPDLADNKNLLIVHDSAYASPLGDTAISKD